MAELVTMSASLCFLMAVLSSKTGLVITFEMNVRALLPDLGAKILPRHLEVRSIHLSIR